MNLKSAGHGAAVEWHQDWAFYPHTNDDVLAVGILLDDANENNGPMMVLPGSHLGPIHDHHSDGAFCGAIDLTRTPLDLSGAVALTAPAGSITIHHARLVHGSAANRSDRPRRLLLFEYAAADAWPLAGIEPIDDFEEFNRRVVHGAPVLEPRLASVPVRMPLPRATHQGSLYENQRTLGHRYFAAPDEAGREQTGGSGNTAGGLRAAPVSGHRRHDDRPLRCPGGPIRPAAAPATGPAPQLHPVAQPEAAAVLAGGQRGGPKPVRARKSLLANAVRYG